MSLDDLVRKAEDFMANKQEAIDGCKGLIKAFNLSSEDLFSSAAPSTAPEGDEGDRGNGGKKGQPAKCIHAIKDEENVFTKLGAWKNRLSKNAWVKVAGDNIVEDGGYYLSKSAETRADALKNYVTWKETQDS